MGGTFSVIALYHFMVTTLSLLFYYSKIHRRWETMQQFYLDCDLKVQPENKIHLPSALCQKTNKTTATHDLRNS